MRQRASDNPRYKAEPKPEFERGKVAVKPHRASGIPPLLQGVATALFLTVFVGTVYSLSHSSSAMLSFRSRIPASSTPPSHDASTFLGYFANKRNFFNQYLVKLSWAWTSAVTLLYVVVAFAFPIRQEKSEGDHLDQTLLRPLSQWVITTAIWYALTQASWFGAPGGLAGRLLTLSGAQCIPASLDAAHLTSSHPLNLAGIAQEVTAPETAVQVLDAGFCRAVGGKPWQPEWGPRPFWQGGHDVSGHIYLLTHATLFLVTLVYPSLPSVFPAPIAKLLPAAHQPRRQATLPVKVATFAALALAALWWWMLAMTSMFFHTPAEKLSGFVFGIGGWLVTSLLVRRS